MASPRGLRRTTIFAGSALLLLVVLFAGWMMAGAQALEPVETAEAVRGAIGTRVSASGFVVPQRSVPVYVTARERVRDVKAVPGQTVKRGDLLIALETGEARRDLRRRLLALRRAELAVATAALGHPCHTAESTECLALRSRELDLEEARGDLADARGVLSDLTIESPVAGLVVGVHVKAGDIAGDPTAPALVLAASSEWQVEIEADEFEIREIVVGQNVSTMVPALSATPCAGRVISAPSVHRARIGIGAPTLFRLAATLLCDVQPTVAGLSAHVEIETSNIVDATLVPLRAIFRDGESAYVVVVRDGNTQRRLVQLGESDTATVQILHGLEVGENVMLGDPGLLRAVAGQAR